MHKFTVRKLNAGEVGVECRAAFEKEYSAWYLKRHPNGNYVSQETGKAWAAWWTAWEIAEEALEKKLLGLFLIIDDVDTLGDIHKPEITPYFKAVQEKIETRSNFCSDAEIDELIERFNYKNIHENYLKMLNQYTPPMTGTDND